MEILDCAKKLSKIVPSDWTKVVFSLFVRECEVNGKQAFSKEFQCKCLSLSTDNVIDLVKIYEENYEVEDTLFEILDFWYQELKDTSDNFIIFKLDNTGNYEIKKFGKIPKDTDNKIIINTVEEYLKK